ncbi:MAG: J domain-containing protein [Treponema sp.]|jgi:DnaJ-domain-containing protein 1|nr:J domain-containing protein [Treponema sp.]
MISVPRIFRIPPTAKSGARRLLWIAGGGAAGIVFGVPGIITGSVLGYFLGEVASQIVNDRALRRYFDNPGPSTFYEGEPGLAAFCALGAFLLSKASPKVLAGEAAAARIAGGAGSVFPTGKKITGLAESFSRIAFSCSLNPDLLTESLAARRAGLGDLPLLASELSSMAMGRDAEHEARFIRQFLDPSYQPPPPDEAVEDPWKTLGVPRNASREEIKSAFRRLALMFHPDNQTGLEEAEYEKTSRAFMQIRDAYRELTRR